MIYVGIYQSTSGMYRSSNLYTRKFATNTFTIFLASTLCTIAMWTSRPDVGINDGLRVKVKLKNKFN